MFPRSASWRTRSLLACRTAKFGYGQFPELHLGERLTEIGHISQFRREVRAKCSNQKEWYTLSSKQGRQRCGCFMVVQANIENGTVEWTMMGQSVRLEEIARRAPDKTPEILQQVGELERLQ